MNVKLVSVTPDAEKNIMYMARVSNPKNQDSSNTKLLDYCIRNEHWSVFEMSNLTVEIETSRGIAAQILRHKSFSFQEYSLRYAKALGFETYPARRQDVKNRQNSIDDMTEQDKKWFKDAQEKIQGLCNAFYEEGLKRNIAKEQCRFLLPLSTKTRMYMNGTVRSWLHFLDLRCQESTQLEHREIADKIKEIFCEQFPNISRAKGWIKEGDQNGSQG